LAFRDYLREHLSAAREYEHLKRKLATKPGTAGEKSREAYARAKTDFVERIVTMALVDGYPRELLHRGAAQKRR
jgi:GrpB-like predicted nucleotidyltransferase (UPF0157 family)